MIVLLMPADRVLGGGSPPGRSYKRSLASAFQHTTALDRGGDVERLPVFGHSPACNFNPLITKKIHKLVVGKYVLQRFLAD